MQPSHEERTEEERQTIAERAYRLHQERGADHGNDLGDWYEAERQLVQEGVISTPAHDTRATYPEGAGS